MRLKNKNMEDWMQLRFPRKIEQISNESNLLQNLEGIEIFGSKLGVATMGY
jgi:hypothetical protein